MTQRDPGPVPASVGSTQPAPPARLARRAFARALGVAALATGLMARPARSQAPQPAGTAPPPGSGAIPTRKQSTLALYTVAQQVPALIEELGGRAKVLFLDVRTRVEAQLLGMAEDVDALVPYMEFPEFPTWDDKASQYKVEPNPRFADGVRARLAEKSLDRGAPIILICRSGDRSAKAVDLLRQLGHEKVWTVLDGFEGDMSPHGRRDVNGWKNAGMPWSYKLVKRKMPLEV